VQKEGNGTNCDWIRKMGEVMKEASEEVAKKWRRSNGRSKGDVSREQLEEAAG
jgi:hypothetical protein